MGGSSEDLTLLLTDCNEGPGKDWLCVLRYFTILFPKASMEDCWTHPRGAKDARGNFKRTEIGKGMAKPLSTSSAINLCIASWHIEADLWFPLSAWNCKSICLSSSEISDRGKDAPWWRICINLGQNGWWRNNSSKSSSDRNSDPNDNWLGCCRSIILFKSKLFSSSSLALNIAASELNLNINEGGLFWGRGQLYNPDDIHEMMLCDGWAGSNICIKQNSQRGKLGKGVYIVSSETRVEIVQSKPEVSDSWQSGWCSEK